MANIALANASNNSTLTLSTRVTEDMPATCTREQGCIRLVNVKTEGRLVTTPDGPVLRRDHVSVFDTQGNAVPVKRVQIPSEGIDSFCWEGLGRGCVSAETKIKAVQVQLNTLNGVFQAEGK
jgi:hypothetical protein